MPWITPTTKATGDPINWVDWVDRVIGNVNELRYRPADGMGGLSWPASSGYVTGSTGTALIAPMTVHHQVEGLNGYNSIGTIAGDKEYHDFTVPKGYSGIWRFVPIVSSYTGPSQHNLMWTLNSTLPSTGFPVSGVYSSQETMSYQWSYLWCLSNMTNTSGTRNVQGVLTERFSSGDTIRFYVAARRNALALAIAGFGRFYAQFLGTTA
jgi:hypothetical protein